MFRHPIRVYWEDTDAGGVVYHAQYLAFLERARERLGDIQLAARHAHNKEDQDDNRSERGDGNDYGQGRFRHRVSIAEHRAALPRACGAERAKERPSTEGLSLSSLYPSHQAAAVVVSRDARLRSCSFR